MNFDVNEERRDEAWRDDFEEYCRQEAINEGCCECGDIPEYKFQGEYFCSECLDDLLNQKFKEDYNIRDKAEILGLEIEEV